MLEQSTFEQIFDYANRANPFPLYARLRETRNPRLVQDPPPYRETATLRGPRHLLVEIDGVRD